MEEDQEKNSNPSIHTFQSDTNKYIKEKNISLADITLKEKIKYKKENKKNKTAYFVIPIVLIALILALTTGYVKFLKNKTPKNIKKSSVNTESFIFSEETKNFEISYDPETGDIKEIFIKSIKNALSQNYKKNSFIKAVFIINKKIIETKEFFNPEFSGLKILANPDFLKSLENNFNINIRVNNEGENSLVLVFKINSFTKTYREMFNLEKTILSGLSPILPEYLKETATTTQNTTTTPYTTINLKEKITDKSSINSKIDEPDIFIDKIINNLDTRVLEKNNRTILIYGFFREKYLIITASEEAFKKSIERLKISLNN